MENKHCITIYGPNLARVEEVRALLFKGFGRALNPVCDERPTLDGSLKELEITHSQTVYFREDVGIGGVMTLTPLMAEAASVAEIDLDVSADAGRSSENASATTFLVLKK